MKHVLITGGSGLVGQFISNRFLAEGWKVTILSRTPPHMPNVHYVPFTLGHSVELPVADLLVHCAFDHLPGRYRGGEGDDPATFRARNFNGSLILFKAAETAHIPCITFLSSRAVYGDYPAGTSLNESLTPRPDSLYGQLKRDTENALADMATADLSTISVRATGVYGPSGGSAAHKWSGLFSDYLNGLPIPPRIATELHGGDLADAIWRLNTAKSGLYNASDITLDRHDLLKMVAQETGCQHPLPARADATQVSAMDTARLIKIGWQPGGMEKLKRTIPALIRHSAR